MKKSLFILILTIILGAVAFGQKTNPNSADETNTKQQGKVSSKNKKLNNSSKSPSANSSVTFSACSLMNRLKTRA